jgi:hypothetical protein
MRQSTRRLSYVILLKVGIIDRFQRTLRFWIPSRSFGQKTRLVLDEMH